jgi:hypothetical protein
LAAIGAVTVCHRIADIIFEPKIFDPNSSSARFSNQSNEAGRYTKGSQKSIGERSKAPLEAVKGFFDRWGQRVIVVLFMVLGAVLLVDGIGWLLGYSLISV